MPPELIAAAAIPVVLLVLARVRAGFWPFRQIVLWAYQVSCWARGHQDSGRELDLMQALPGFTNPYLWVCRRCGAAEVREWEG